MKNFFLVTLILVTGLAKADTSYSTFSEKTFKFIPSFGLMTLKTDYENFNSSINTGIAVEKMLSSRFSVGILFNYATFKFNESDVYELYNYNFFDWGTNYNGRYYGPSHGLNGYNNFYGQDIKSEIFSIGINSKFFILNEGMFRPFLGGGLTYNRNNLEYDYNTNYYYNGYNNGQYDVSVNSFSGLLMAGTELRFSSTFGINFDFKYIKTLGNNSDDYYSNYTTLEYLGREMADSDYMSFNAGILIAI